MWEKVKDSLDKLLYDRLSSPLYGTLIVSWLIWNWKIVYLTLFVSQAIVGNKIHYIEVHLSNPWILVAGPLISTFAIIYLIPHIANAAHAATIEFERKRLEKKNELEKNVMLTVEQGAEIMNKVADQETKFRNLVKANEEDMKLLRGQVQMLRDEKAGMLVTANRLRIILALYGNEGKQLIDVTQEVKKRQSKDSLAIEVGYAALGLSGDPLPGIDKFLYVYYEHKQEPGREVREHGKILSIGNP